ncbi:plasmid mobilization protein [Actinomycetospora sp. C-140]
MAAADSSPATFRVSPEERYLLEAVAHYTGKTMSAFVREAALVLARKVVDDAGPEAVLEGDREWSQKGRLTIEERRRALEHQREMSHDDTR